GPARQPLRQTLSALCPVVQSAMLFRTRRAQLLQPWPFRSGRKLELEQLTDLNVAVGGQLVYPLESGVHVREVHDVERLDLPLASATSSTALPTGSSSKNGSARTWPP